MLADGFSPDGPDLRSLTDPYVVMAFGGWNDASASATDALNHLLDISAAEVAFSLDPDEYYDFQMNRPTISRPNNHTREIEWPSTEIWVGRLGTRDLVLVTGPEPNLRWRSFSAAVVSALRICEPKTIVMLGAMLADTAHTRPIPVTATAATAKLAAELGLEPTTYEGPTGIVGVLADACAMAGFEVISLWAAVPHYASAAPNPRVTLSLLERLEDVLDVSINPGDLPQLAQAWDRGIAQIVNEDAELADYIQSLEAEQDDVELPEASGETIAAEFQRYLRRHER